MNRYQLISMIAAICFASTANAAYEVELANIYACAWCNNDLSGYNDEEYDNFHNAGFTCGDPNDCMHFVSQILQHGCMGICVSYCGERIDPAIYDLDHFCVRCQSDYRTVYRNPTMTSCVEHGLEVFPNSSYWFEEGPFTNTTFLAHPNNGGPQWTAPRGLERVSKKC
ncbi:MAG: amidase domain-containing protein [Calditrichaeota bacterium]|nr:amidase domain-containing protein [Calditrichota bacterium]MCB9367109.1 amidase domain-containing protein [Calditrichota bacterium]MCB9391881.1 amidase domain-containing protein [Calditrichota bacterium]